MVIIELVQQLESASGDILGSLRMLEGLDKQRFTDLIGVVDRCAKQFEDRKELPKEIGGIFFDIYPAIVSASYLYPKEITAQIQEAAEKLADHIRSVFCT